MNKKCQWTGEQRFLYPLTVHIQDEEWRIIWTDWV